MSLCHGFLDLPTFRKDGEDAVAVTVKPQRPAMPPQPRGTRPGHRDDGSSVAAGKNNAIPSDAGWTIDVLRMK